MTNQTQYDYIIAGAGCAGLSLLLRILKSDQLKNKKILLIDRDVMKRNDRTWCFWEEQPGFFEPLVYRQWSKLDFFGEGYEDTFYIDPYRYKMIRGVDFYTYCLSEIARYSNVDKLFGDIGDMVQDNGRVTIKVGAQVLDAGKALVFSSIPEPARPRTKELTILQHFKGWVIQTPQGSFDPAKATLMDFRIPQQHGTSFVYVLPFDQTTALVEYTLFTKELLKDHEYDAGLQAYLQDQLGLGRYTVLEEEFGIIPMTSRRFNFYSNGVYHLGTAGGQTKASTGYTFQFIQKHSAQIVEALESGKPLSSIQSTPARFRFYDNTLLHILFYDKLPGKKIFSTLFRKNDAPRVLRFLDNQTSLSDELKLISSLPTWPFLKAAMASVGEEFNY